MLTTRHEGCLAPSMLSIALLVGCGADDAAKPPRDSVSMRDAASDAALTPPSVTPHDAGAACAPGERDCACARGARCNAGLRCSGGRCETCPAGTESCPCGAGERCGADLTCMSGVCAVVSCEPGRLGCPCRDGTCGDGLACGSDALCHTCDADAVGCACQDGTCTAGLTCDASSNTCRQRLSCAELVSQGRCAPHQSCNQAAGAEATCVLDTCDDGYRWEADAKACVECRDCVSGGDCSSGANGIGNVCAAAFRTCVAEDTLARCGGCIEDAEDVGGVCLPASRCGSAVCDSSQYCDRLAQQCKPLPCPSGEAKRDAPGAICSPCTTTCTGLGFTGRFWPFRSKSDKCVCETEPSFFIEAGAFMAQRCDADGDGWVRHEADDTAIREDEALLQNARCKIQRIDRARLRDEYGAELVLRSCRAEGFVSNPAASCGEVYPLRLLETERNDVALGVVSAQTPSYGREGRRLYGAELNGLTKACVDELGDFDDNGVEDLNQVQPTQFGVDATDRERLQGLSHFLELVQARYEPPGADQAYGSLILEERSRCDAASFPFHYAAEDAYVAGAGSDANPGYWRSCSRFREAGYAAARPRAGYDFAQWSCSDAAGSCSSLAALGPAHPSQAYASVDPGKTLLRGGGLCELAGKPPKDGAFRGFGHHSQFRCLRVVNTPTQTNEAAPSSFGTTSTWIFDSCHARSCQADDTGCQESRPISGSKSFQPILECEPAQPATGQVGFGLRNYQPYGRSTLYSSRQLPATYQSGCVNEDAEWSNKLCPAPEFVMGYETDFFGRYSCFGDKSRWLWAPASGPQRASLYWSGSLTVNPNMSVWSIP